MVKYGRAEIEGDGGKYAARGAFVRRHHCAGYAWIPVLYDGTQHGTFAVKIDR